MKSLEEIKIALIRNKEKINREFKVREIGIFGSFVRGEQKETSDIDILVEFEKEGRTFDNYMNLKFFLEDLFQRRVDLVMKSAIKKSLKPYIMEEVVYV